MANNGSTRAAAQAALDAYKAQPGMDSEPDDITIIDLIVDLLHLTDSIGGSGATAVEWARDYYEDERGADD
jgi:hypothetical protein